MRECASYSYCAHSWRQQTNPSRKNFLSGWKCYISSNRDMKHLGSLESTQEARVPQGLAESNFYASFMLSKLPACFISQCSLDCWKNIWCHQGPIWPMETIFESVLEEHNPKQLCQKWRWELDRKMHHIGQKNGKWKVGTKGNNYVQLFAQNWTLEN